MGENSNQPVAHQFASESGVVISSEPVSYPLVTNRLMII